MKKAHLIALGMLSGLLLALSWPLRGFPLLLFIAFIPFLFVDDYLIKKKDEFSRWSAFLISYPGFFVFNGLTVYWIWNSTLSGGIGALFLNSFFMTTAFSIYHLTRRSLYTHKHGNFLLLFFWLGFEYFHLDWDLTFPWLNLGNGFATWHKWVQWYEYTGALGGSFWILLINLLIYKVGLEIKTNKGFNKISIASSIGILLLIIIPVMISYRIYNQYEEKEDPAKIVIAQPNLDPYSEQYGLAPQVVINRITELLGPIMEKNVDFIVCPESANQENMFERQLEQYLSIRMLRDFMRDYPKTSMVIGASTFKVVTGKDTSNNAARKFTRSNGHYFAFNAAMCIDQQEGIQLYHKSKLTPGVEKMPSWRILAPLERFAIDLGGTIGTLATDNMRSNFVGMDETKVGTVICYESIYGEFVSRFVRNGAELIFIITNDGWWGDTPGYKQHFVTAKLRAIETRRSIARSANTGISAFINQKGDVIQQTDYWVKDVIKGEINKNTELTFYTKNGDYIARISSFIAVIFMLLAITMRLMKRKALR